MKLPQFPESRNGGEITALSLLTPRERQVARLVALGHTNAEAAELLEIRSKTVETHRTHLMSKLGLRTRADLVRFALAQGLLDDAPDDRFFQCCVGCHALWPLRSRFLSDRELTFRGYQDVNGPKSQGALLFLHNPCGATILVALEMFVELAGEPLLAASCSRIETRPDYCLGKAASQPCPFRCACAFVWRTYQIVSRWPKPSS